MLNNRRNSILTLADNQTPNFSIKFDFLERQKLCLKSTRERKIGRIEKDMAAESEKMNYDQSKVASSTDTATAASDAKKKAMPEETSSVVVYSEEDVNSFVDEMVAKNTKRSTATAVRRLEQWYKEKHGEELDLNTIGKEQAPALLKHFFLEIRQMGNGNKGKEYEPGTLQTYRNGLRRYFLDRPCPPAVDNFDLEKSSMLEFEEVAKILSAKKKDLKKKGLGNKPNAALPVEEEELEKMWSSGAIGLHNPRALLHLVWWNNMTHLGMRAVQEQHDCQIQDFSITDQYIEYTERQTKNRQGDDGAARKRARKYNNKIWKTDGGERDPYRAFMEYVSHRPQGENAPANFFLTPIGDKIPSQGDVWFKACPVGRNTLAKQMKIIAEVAGLSGKYSNSTGRKTVIQSLRDDFHPLEICELTGHANPESISSYSHNPLEKQRRMSNQLAGFNEGSNTTTTTTFNGSSSSASTDVLEFGNARNLASHNRAGDTAEVHGSTPFPGAIRGLFSGVTFNNSPVNISINLQSSVN